MRLIAAMEEESSEPIEVEVLLARKHRPTSPEVPRDWRVSVALPPDYFFYMTPARFWASFVAAVWRTFRAAVQSELDREVKPLLTEILSALRALEGRGAGAVDQRPWASKLPPSMIIARARAAAAGGDNHRAATAALWPGDPDAGDPLGKPVSAEPAQRQIPWDARRHRL